MYLATTESPLSVTMGGGEALIWPSAVLGGEGVPELDGQDSSNSSGELGPVARALEASGSLDLWDLDGLRVWGCQVWLQDGQCGFKPHYGSHAILEETN